jgi:hypothetical protein
MIVRLHADPSRIPDLRKDRFPIVAGCVPEIVIEEGFDCASVSILAARRADDGRRLGSLLAIIARTGSYCLL